MRIQLSKNLRECFGKQGRQNVYHGILHLLVMLGATITVPLLAGMNVSLALLSSGVGTLIFMFMTKKQAPMYLGSSFAFLPGIMTIFSQKGYSYNAEALAVMLGLLAVAVAFVIFAILVRVGGDKILHRLFPPIVIGPLVVIIGMNLAFTTVWNNIMSQYIVLDEPAWKEWTAALVTLIAILVVHCSCGKKTVLKNMSLIIGLVVGLLYSVIIGLTDFDFSGKAVIFQQTKELWGFWGAWKELDGGLIGTAILSLVPIAVVAFAEHFGDMTAVGKVVGKDVLSSVGLSRTLFADGAATAVGVFLGGPANTTYGENLALMTVTGNKRTAVIGIAAVCAIVLGVLSPIGEFLAAIPKAVLGGAGFYLFGMLSANGIKAVMQEYESVDQKGNKIMKKYLDNSKNMLVMGLTLAVGLGLGALSMAGEIVNSVTAGQLGEKVYQIGFYVSDGSFVKISGLAVATLVGILLNLILPEVKGENRDKNEEQLVAAFNIQDDGNLLKNDDEKQSQ